MLLIYANQGTPTRSSFSSPPSKETDLLDHSAAMQLIRTLASYWRQNHVHLLGGQGPRSPQLSVIPRPETSAFEQACCHLMGRAPSSSHHNNDLLAHNNGVTKMDGKASVEAAPPPPAPRKASLYTWAKWAIGSLVALLLPLWSTRWQRLQLIGSEVENALKVAETAAEVVEEVAVAAEKVSAEVAEKLPEGGKLKEAALAMQNATKEAIAGAETVEDIIHKVDELEQEVKTLLKPVMQPTKNNK